MNFLLQHNGALAYAKPFASKAAAENYAIKIRLAEVVRGIPKLKPGVEIVPATAKPLPDAPAQLPPPTSAELPAQAVLPSSPFSTYSNIPIPGAARSRPRGLVTCISNLDVGQCAFFPAASATKEAITSTHSTVSSTAHTIHKSQNKTFVSRRFWEVSEVLPDRSGPGIVVWRTA